MQQCENIAKGITHGKGNKNRFDDSAFDEEIGTKGSHTRFNSSRTCSSTPPSSKSTLELSTTSAMICWYTLPTWVFDILMDRFVEVVRIDGRSDQKSCDSLEAKAAD
jgi:hypothetical protein